MSHRSVGILLLWKSNLKYSSFQKLLQEKLMKKFFKILFFILAIYALVGVVLMVVAEFANLPPSLVVDVLFLIGLPGAIIGVVVSTVIFSISFFGSGEFSLWRRKNKLTENNFDTFEVYEETTTTTSTATYKTSKFVGYTQRFNGMGCAGKIIAYLLLPFILLFFGVLLAPINMILILFRIWSW